MAERRPLRAAVEPGEASDGRVRRGARNRQRIVDALYELIGGGRLLPTAEEVARRAGVGERTVFRHFEDMEALHSELARRLHDELRPLLEQTPVGDSRPERVRALVEQRSRLYESMAPYRRSGDLLRHRSPFLRREKSEGDRILRAELVRLLGPELRGGGEDRLEALDALLSFEAWERLRVAQRLSRERTRQVLASSLLALLE